MGTGPITSPSDFFLEMAEPTALASTGTSKSDQYLCILLISSLEMEPFTHNIHLKFPSRSRPMGPGPSNPPIFSWKWLNLQPWCPQELQIRPISLHIINFKPRNGAIHPQYSFEISK